MLKCDPASLSFGSTLPHRLSTLIIRSSNESVFPYIEYECIRNVRSLPQLCCALRGLPALERFSLHRQDLRLHTASLLAALQHSTLLKHLEFEDCALTRLTEG